MPMSDQVEWECPECGNGYVLPPALLQREKEYHHHRETMDR